MKIEFTPEWCKKMADLEDGSPISAMSPDLVRQLDRRYCPGCEAVTEWEKNTCKECNTHFFGAGLGDESHD